MKNSTRQRSALILKVSDSPFFEEAHLILKENASLTQEGDMVKEAMRIIASCRPSAEKKKSKRPRSPLFYFLCGLFCAPAILLTGCLFLLLLSRCGVL
ncbi:MAG: hypothetical protein IJX59_05320 [Clostridia bacterium]|nr:hypothetical protein [Clostridia bacterium]MBQ9130166.1 hypothetical protein [Clostridia bacterium]